MDNVYDIRYKKSLSYIFSTDGNIDCKIAVDKLYKEVAVILYLYYEDTASYYFKYIKNIPESVNLYIISSRQSVLEIYCNYVEKVERKNTTFILKENRGRDVSALLVTARDVVKAHKYICFVHDKKEHKLEFKTDTDLWVENLWGNMLGSSDYIAQILHKFESDHNLGILAPPDPIGDSFCTWYGYGWHGSYDVTKQLAEKIGLNANLDSKKPPITIGTALWFRTEALKKLFEFNWGYELFDDEKLNDSNYLSYGIERIFAYVAQDAGFDTGEIMTLEYAQKQNNYLHYSMPKIFFKIQSYFPFPSITAIESYDRNVPRLLEFARANEKLFLYGAGDMGRFCLSFLRREGIEPSGFIVTGNVEQYQIDNLSVVNLYQLESDKIDTVGVVITVVAESMQKQMQSVLDNLGIRNYLIFWK